MRPPVTVFGERGPLAGDVAACLSGRFKVSHVLTAADALQAVAGGSRALLVTGCAEPGPLSRIPALVTAARHHHCRILLLGCGGLDLAAAAEDGADPDIVYLSSLPSPQQLFISLADIAGERQAGAS